MPRRPSRRGARSRATPRSSSASPARKAVIYARVSSREQEREGYSIPAQLDLLRAYAAENNFDVVEEFTDVETAKRTGRTHFNRMLTFLRKKRPSPPAILVEKTDRLYRNLKDWVSVDGIKADVHLVKEGVVLSDESRSSEKFVHGIKVLMAKNYVDNLSEEVRKGMNHKAAEGHWPSSAPIGYLNRREAGRSYIVPDPERALMIRNLFELYDTGDWSVSRLARYANEQGLRGKRGGKISPSVVHSVLRNPLYGGRFWWGGELYEGRDPRLIPWELFERVQARLDGHPYTRPQRREFAFTGMMTCGHCGSLIPVGLVEDAGDPGGHKAHHRVEGGREGCTLRELALDGRRGSLPAKVDARHRRVGADGEPDHAALDRARGPSGRADLLTVGGDAELARLDLVDLIALAAAHQKTDHQPPHAASIANGLPL